MSIAPHLLVLLLMCASPALSAAAISGEVVPTPTADDQTPAHQRSGYAIILHGGAGDIRPERMSPAIADEYRRRLQAALAAGEAVLAQDGSSTDAVVAAVAALEADPYFNAGTGSVLAADGTVEMDASLMVGDGRRSGAVAAVSRTQHPIHAARAVMEHTRHVLLVGPAADTFAEDHGVTMVANDHFVTPWQQRKLLDTLRTADPADQDDRHTGGQQTTDDHDAGAQRNPNQHDDATFPGEPDGRNGPHTPGSTMGTVGCVALDRAGHLAAATSTGGTVGKVNGRVGDSAIIGAGTYAQDGVCAVSATGHGESFLTVAAAHHIAQAIQPRGLSVQQAADEALTAVDAIGGDGGVIMLGADGTICLRFTSAGMFRAWVREGGQPEMKMFGTNAAEER